VTFSVHLDNDFALMASQVGEEGTDGVLTPKLEPSKPATAKMFPEDSLRRGHLLAKAPRSFSARWIA
jgi:hypothetical protein